MPRSFTFATIAEYRAAKGSSGAIYAELVSSGIKSGSCVSKITATGDVFIDSINPFVTPELGQEGDNLYYSSTEGYRFLRAGNTTWDADSYGQVFIDLAKIPSGFSVVAPYTDVFTFKKTTEDIGSGKASMTKILGNTVAWNSILHNGRFSDTSYWSAEGTFSVSGNIATYLCDRAAGWFYQTSMNVVSSHKYLQHSEIKKTTAYADVRMFFVTQGADAGMTTQSTNSWQAVNRIISAPATTDNGKFVISDRRSGSWDNIYIRNCFVVDLTLLYGTAIDGMTDEQILAKFESEFPGYHSYNPGQLLSNKAKAIEFVGFNKFDEGQMGGWGNIIKTAEGWQGTVQHFQNHIFWENDLNYDGRMCVYLKASSATSGSNFRLVFYYTDGTKEIAVKLSGTSVDSYGVSASGKKVQVIAPDYSNSATITIEKLCINLSGKRNGQYEPYKKVVLPLPNLDQIKVYSHNLYDPATGKAKVEGGKQYYIGGTYTSISQNGTAITVSSHLFTPSASGDVDVVGGNSTDTIINLSSSFNGQYEPHGILTMEGGLKSAGSVRDEIVGNKLIRRLKRVDMGDLAWTRASSGVFYCYVMDKKNGKSNFIEPKYVVLDVNDSTEDKVMFGASSYYSLNLRDSLYDTKNDLVEAISGTPLDYELATPIEYEIYSPTKMPFNWKYRVSEYHTKKMLPENGENPTSAPFACEIKQI